MRYTLVCKFYPAVSILSMSPRKGTPHTHHYDNALDAIKAGKHVLCEKPATCNAAELRSLLEAAKQHGVFFMEALWTRFQPLTIEVKRIIDDGSLGAPVFLQADLSGYFALNGKVGLNHRILPSFKFSTTRLTNNTSNS